MENLKTKTPNNELIKIQVNHLGKILFNLQFIALAIMIASVLSFLIPAIYYLVLIFISLITLFSIYATHPEFSNLWRGGDTLANIATTLTNSWKYTVPIILVLAISSIICLTLSKQENHKYRIITSVVLSILAIIVLVLKLINGGTV